MARISLLERLLGQAYRLLPGMLVTAPAISEQAVARACWSAQFAASRSASVLAPSPAVEKGKNSTSALRLNSLRPSPALFLDNANGVVLQSDTLASDLLNRARPARRFVCFGQTRMVPLNSIAFLAITGNGLTVTEDLARRFNPCELDARCEDPEARPVPREISPTDRAATF